MRPRKIQTLSSVTVVDEGTEGPARKFHIELTTAASVLMMADFLAENGAYHSFGTFLEAKVREGLELYIKGVEAPLAAARKNFVAAKKEQVGELEIKAA